MGALCGYSGPPRPDWDARLQEALAHRAHGPPARHASPRATLFHLPIWEAGTHSRAGSGLFTDTNPAAALAVAGIRTGPAEWQAGPDLLQAWKTQGAGILHRLTGAFILAGVDERQLVLGRDGAGRRALYYAWHDQRLCFAAEPKAIFCLPGFPRRLRPAAVAQFLTFSFIPGQGTMLEGLHELPAGHRLIVPHDTPALPDPDRWFRPEEEPAPEGLRTDSDWIAHFRQTVTRATDQLRPPGEPVAVFLSGGIDSSAVAAELQDIHDAPCRAFAIHFGRHFDNELEFARSVADRIGMDYEEVEIRPRQFLPRLRRILWHLDEPIGDPVTVPNFELAGHVARDFRWTLNGEGGDPCLGGPKNLPMLLDHWYGGPPRKPGFRERAYLASYRRGYDEIGRLLTPEFQRLIDPERDLESLVAPFFQAARPSRFLDKLMAVNIRLKGAHLILPKVERMNAAWGLTPLSPLFDEAIARLSFQLPPHLRLARGIEKVVLKEAFRDRLPRAVIDRPKSGMRVPVYFWFQGEMKRYARSILSPRALRRDGIWNPDRVRQLLDYDTEEGPGRYGIRLWMLLTFEIWRRLVIEKEPV